MYDFSFNIGDRVVLITSVQDFIEREMRRIQDDRDSLNSKSDTPPGMFRLGRIFGQIEEGDVIGRSEYAAARNSYLVRFKAGDGRQVEDWFTEAAIASRENCVDEAHARLDGNGARAKQDGDPTNAAAEFAEVESRADVTDRTIEAGDKITFDRTITEGDRSIRTFITVPLNA